MYVEVEPIHQKAEGKLLLSNVQMYDFCFHSPIEANIGPSALAKAPNERKIPRTIPFWSCLPYSDISVVIQVTTNAVAKMNCIQNHYYYYS